MAVSRTFILPPEDAGEALAGLPFPSHLDSLVETAAGSEVGCWNIAIRRSLRDFATDFTEALAQEAEGLSAATAAASALRAAMEGAELAGDTAEHKRLSELVLRAERDRRIACKEYGDKLMQAVNIAESLVPTKSIMQALAASAAARASGDHATELRSANKRRLKPPVIREAEIS